MNTSFFDQMNPITFTAPDWPYHMSNKDLITLLSLDDEGECESIRTRLESEGISCFMKARRKPVPSIPSTDAGKPVDIRVYLKDLDRALQLIADDPNERKNESPDPGP